MALTVILADAAILLVVSALSIFLHTSAAGRIVVYGASLIVSGVGIVAALMQLLGQGPTEVLTLPIGLPWLGAHFRLDALSAFFLVVVNLGGAAASLYALGYGKHEHAPQRVLPFYPLFLAGMNLVTSPTTPSPSSSPGNSCRCRRGRWSWRTTSCARTCARAMSISSWRASARSLCCSPSACWRVRKGNTPSTRSARAIPRQRSRRLF